MSEYIEMSIVRDDIGSIGCECAIYEFVIVAVGFDKPKVELRVYKLNVVTLNDSVDDILSYTWRCLACDDFLILFQNLI